MEMLKKVCKQLKDEIKSAEGYGKMAIQLKDTDKIAANMYYEIANQELDHAERLQKYCNKHIDEINDMTLRGIWDWQKEAFAEDIKDIKMLLDMYK